MIDDFAWLQLILIISPIYLVWKLIGKIISWENKIYIKISVLFSALTLQAMGVENLHDIFWFLSNLIFYVIWYLQIKWNRPKLTYEL